MGLGVTEPPPKPATHEEALPVQRAQSPDAHGRRSSRALAAAVLALITMVAGAVALVAAKRSNQRPTALPDDSANGKAVANETIGQRFPNTETMSKSRVEIPAPETRASAVPGSATAAPTPSYESEAMKATQALEAKPARASTAAVRHSAAQKKIPAPGRGKRYVVRRTITRRTVITTSR